MSFLFDQMKAQGCVALQTSIASLKNVVSLDLTDNMFDSELPSLFGWIQVRIGLFYILPVC